MKSLKELIVEVQQGKEEAKQEMYTRFLPLVHKISKGKSILFVREDLEQDLWEYFWKCAMIYDPEKAEHFAACLCKRLSLHMNYLLRSCWKQHTVEGQSVEELDEMGYEWNSEALALEDVKREFQKADCPSRLLQVALLLAEGMDRKEICMVMGVSQQAFSKHKVNLKKFLEGHPELVKFLRSPKA